MKKVLAVFDFDGTVTRLDTLLFFLIFNFGFCSTIFKLGLLLPSFLHYSIHRLKIALFPSKDNKHSLLRQKMKEKILTQFFCGLQLDQLTAAARRFSYSDLWKKLVRSEALQRIDWHQRQGHQCVIVSAGIDLCVTPCGEAIGLTHVLASRLDVSECGEVTGRLNGLNCWGEEKVRRLEAAFGPIKEYVIYAYGDSRGDRELLSMADHAYYKTFPKE